MAGRPIKTGLDYFELDCHMEEKVRLIQAEFGLKGFAIVVKLFQKIYGEFGYYCEWNEDSSLLFMSENGVSSREEKNLIQEIVSACIRRNIFSETIYEKYSVLTSVGIQKRYLVATSKREIVKMKKEYLLLSVGELNKNVVINSISDGINSINGVDNTQRREEKSREENNIDTNVSIRTSDDARIRSTWNSLKDVGIKPIRSILSNRKKLLDARIGEYGVDAVLEAIENVRYSTFLRGRNNRNWMIDFDWFIRPNCFPKVLEGKYTDIEKPTSLETSNTKNNNAPESELSDDEWLAMMQKGDNE